MAVIVSLQDQHENGHRACSPDRGSAVSPLADTSWARRTRVLERAGICGNPAFFLFTRLRSLPSARFSPVLITDLLFHHIRRLVPFEIDNSR